MRHKFVWFVCVYAAIEILVRWYGHDALLWTDAIAARLKIEHLERLDFRPDVIFYGDSRMLGAVLPTEFDETARTRSYNLSVGGSTPYLGRRLYHAHRRDKLSEVRFFFIQLSDANFNPIRFGKGAFHGMNIHDYYSSSGLEVVENSATGWPAAAFGWEKYWVPMMLKRGLAGQETLEQRIERFAYDGRGYSNPYDRHVVYGDAADKLAVSGNWFNAMPDPGLYTVRDLEAFIEELKADGVVPILVVMPLHPEILTAGRKIFPKELSAYDKFYANLACRRDAWLIDLRDPASFSAQGFGDDVHLNKQSSLLFSRHLAKALAAIKVDPAAYRCRRDGAEKT